MSPSSPSRRVLVVEDDHPIAASIVRGLRKAGFEVELCANGRSGLATALDRPFDLIVLDLMLPECDGFELLRAWRTRISTPVVVLTAMADLDARLQSFELGAVDWMPKPFWIEELVARINLRLQLETERPHRVVGWGTAEVDLDSREARVDGQPIPLTTTEFSVLAYLVERPTRPVVRQQLCEEVLPAGGERNDRMVDAFITRIRRKLGPASSAIETVWGLGYRFHPRGEQ